MPDTLRILHLYTLYFPQGSHEAFIEPEIAHLAKHFDKVKVFPQMRTGEAMRETAANVQVCFLEGDLSIGLLARLNFMGPNLLMTQYLSNFRYEMGKAAQILERKALLSAYIRANKGAIHYSYWFDEWAAVLGLLSKEKLIPGYVTRAHGFDLYDERQHLGYHPFRHIQKHGLKKIFPVSELGSEYLKDRLKHISIETAYLGTEDYGPGPHPENDRTRILSVARAVPLKRLDRVATVMALCKEPLTWTHIGSGPELDGLKKIIKDFPSHIEVQFLGEMSHEKVMELYQTQAFHLLISLSESEGLPVSMMEAMSFGVPVLSTDVGGVHEMVNVETGLLLAKTVTDEEISEIIDGWRVSSKATEEFRSKLRAYWKDHFSAKKNYPEFVKKLKGSYQA